MDLDELRAFVAVVETGSLLAAARSARFARATLRRRVDELEARVGVPLLTRSGDGLVPTAAGLVLERRAREILNDVGALMSAVRGVPSEEQEPSGLLRVVVAAGLPPPVLTMAAATLTQKFPRMRAELRITEDPLTELDDTDLALYFGEEAPPGAWRSHELFRTRLQLFATPAYLDAHGLPRRVAELSSHRIAAWRAAGQTTDALPLVDGSELVFAPFFTSTDPHLLHLLASHDEALVLAPHADGRGPLEASDLVVVLPELVGRDVSVRIASSSGLADTPRVRSVLEYLLTFFGQPGP
jgi:DNA-binding transcriptional LysR family regulator